MPSTLLGYSTAFERWIDPWFRRVGRAAMVLALGTLTPGCTAAPKSPVTGPDPSNSTARTAPATYRSTVAPYVSRRPVEPAAWQEQNQRVAPPASPAP